MNDIIRKLTAQNFLNLKSSFENSKDIFWNEDKNTLIHPGEYGSYRESLLKKWLRMYVPREFEISSGFVINPENKISTQCDIIIYNKNNTPIIENSNQQKFFPIETVVAVGEVKSTINSPSELNTYLKKLSELKKLRNCKISSRIHKNIFDDKFDIFKNPFHNIFTFLVCYKFNFTPNKSTINYGNINTYYYHNAIFSIIDGTLNYYVNDGGIAYSFIGNKRYPDNFVKATKSELSGHIVSFLSSLNIALRFTLQFEVDLVTYLAKDSNIVNGGK